MSLRIFIEKILKRDYPKESSYKTNESTIRSFMGFSGIQTIDDITKLGSEVIEVVMNYPRARETRRKVLLILMRVFTELKLPEQTDALKRVYLELKTSIRKDRKKNEPRTEKEKVCLETSLDDLREVKINHDDQDKSDLIFNLLVHSDYSPRLDYRTVIFKPTERKGKNYITEKCTRIVLNNYKTAAKYGKWVIPLHGKLRTYLRRYVEARNIRPNEFLFATRHAEAPSAANFSTLIEKTFKKKVGKPIRINTLRKIKEIQLYHRNPETMRMSLKQHEDLVVKYFRHSHDTAIVYYNRVQGIE